MTPHESDVGGSSTGEMDRRDFLSNASSLAMAGGLVGGYGTLAIFAGEYLYPAKPTPKGWLFAVDIRDVKPGESFSYTTPAGDKVIIARKDAGMTDESFIALSSTCPHLGCRVHWESQRSQFFCPCHNGAFDAGGNPLSGPPAAANTPLAKFKLRIENSMLFVEVELESLPIGSRSSGGQHT